MCGGDESPESRAGPSASWGPTPSPARPVWLMAEAHSFVHTPFFKDLGHSGLLNGFFI